MHISEYRVKANTDLTIALVSDLHEYDSEDVIDAVKAANPDLIAFAGDILEFYRFKPSSGKIRPEGLAAEVERRTFFFNEALRKIVGRIAGEKQNRGPENAYRLLREAAKIAPAFYSTGNHEWYIDDDDRKAIRETGVTLLENEFVAFGEILVGGVAFDRPRYEWVKDFASKEGFKVLICHQPEVALRRFADQNIDLILAGHAHGGQIRFGKRGVIAPGQGLLPKYVKGQFGNLIVSTGCSNTVAVPRLGNPKEIVVIKLERESSE